LTPPPQTNSPTPKEFIQPVSQDPIASLPKGTKSWKGGTPTLDLADESTSVNIHQETVSTTHNLQPIPGETLLPTMTPDPIPDDGEATSRQPSTTKISSEKESKPKPPQTKPKPPSSSRLKERLSEPLP
jgi:hypothetical protein